MLEELKKFIGEKLYMLVTLVAMGYALAIFLPTFIVTAEAYASDKKKLEQKIDTVAARLDINMAKLELSSLREEKNRLLDLMDEGKAKPRHKDRLTEVNDRIKELQDNMKRLEKVLDAK